MRATKNQIAVLLSVPLSVIGIIIADWYNAIPYSLIAFHISYIRLFQLCLLLLSLVACVILYFFLRKTSKPVDSVQSPTQQTPTQPETEKEKQRAKEESLHHLSSDEKKLLRLHFERDKKDMEHSYGSGAAPGLAHRGILCIPPQEVSPVPYFVESRITYYVSDWAWIYLKKHPKLLEDTRSKEERRAELLRELPDQAKRLLLAALDKNEKCFRFYYQDSAMKPLLLAGEIIYKQRHNEDCCVSPWVWEMIQKDRSLIEVW
ncbi:MAG: super-infection exclusion protein B [Bacteroidota bacterium]